MDDMANMAKKAEAYLESAGKLTEECLRSYIPNENEIPGTLHSAMRYALLIGGKRLRPALARAAYEFFGGKQSESICLAMCALEMLHTFSLIHDDLPCMDDDDFRRGKPSTHKVYGEATAVLAGDALCIFAFELIARAGSAAVIEELAHSLGTRGMIGGQIIDIESEGKSVDLATVDYIHHHKTAALIEASLVIGALLANAEKEDLEHIREFGRGIGLVFQIVDDILDIESSTEKLGKDVGSDVKNGKATYPAVLGLEASKQKATELYNKSLTHLEGLRGRNTETLRNIAALIIERTH
ncbi:MAG: polyprenyl synthetase family protein [Candidatus Fibromonas sp.]|jgi:geranylgeranyl diphosphate synthase type II|nr:polyprenyl synthetase family protein [Candidatus Fibromonas sp.]